jgi:hypothetical protein
MTVDGHLSAVGPLWVRISAVQVDLLSRPVKKLFDNNYLNGTAGWTRTTGLLIHSQGCSQTRDGAVANARNKGRVRETTPSLSNPAYTSPFFELRCRYRHAATDSYGNKEVALKLSARFALACPTWN